MGYRDICTSLTERQWPHKERERAFEQQWPQDRERSQLEHTISRQNSTQLVLLLSDTDMPRAVNSLTGRQLLALMSAKFLTSFFGDW